jgi:hypothetical protein
MEDFGNKIRLTYYEASDGPRLMMFGPMTVDLQNLQSLFRRLASKPDQPIMLDEEPFVVPFQGIKVKLLSAEGAKGRLGLRRTKCLSKLEFEWTLSADYWDDLVERLEGLIKPDTPGHQYMDAYAYEDAIVVVSKGEYSDEIIMRNG